jgi:hypothetical protein
MPHGLKATCHLTRIELPTKAQHHLPPNVTDTLSSHTVNVNVGRPRPASEGALIREKLNRHSPHRRSKSTAITFENNVLVSQLLYMSDEQAQKNKVVLHDPLIWPECTYAVP